MDKPHNAQSYPIIAMVRRSHCPVFLLFLALFAAVSTGATDEREELLLLTGSSRTGAIRLTLDGKIIPTGIDLSKMRIVKALPSGKLLCYDHVKPDAVTPAHACILSIRGGSRTLLPNMEGADWAKSDISADGKIVIVPVGNNISVINVEERKPMPALEKLPDGHRILGATASPDGRHVAFYEAVQDWNFCVRLIEIGKKRALSLTPWSVSGSNFGLGEQMEGQVIQWDSHGKSVYFVACFGSPDSEWNGRGPQIPTVFSPRIYRASIEDNALTELAPGCSPIPGSDGNRIYYWDVKSSSPAVYLLQDKRAFIFGCDADKGLRAVNEPIPSPSGKYLVQPFRKRSDRGASKIAMMDCNGRLLKMFTPDVERIGRVFWLWKPGEPD